jgi:uncharacterized protein
MRTIVRLFAKSPFAPLQTHMKRVSACVDKLSTVFSLLAKENDTQIEKLVIEISHLEHEADITKNDIRNHLPRSLFLPIDRGHFLEILSVQDRIADKTEDIGLLLTLKPLEKIEDMHQELYAFFKKSEAVFHNAKQIIEEIDELLESSFGGIEAEKVKEMVEVTAAMEHDTDRMQRVLLKKLFIKGDHLSPPAFILWCTLIQEVGLLAELSEKLANRIRMVLELK